MDATTQPPPLSNADRVQQGFRYALALTHHPEDAEDLVQEAWLNLCRRYGAVESTPLLFTAVRNLFVDQCRRRKVVAFESLDATEMPEIAAAPAAPPGIRGDLAFLLGVLRPVEREALYLHYYEGHTAEEIAELTSKPRGTVLSLLHRALAKLREAAEAPSDTSRRNQWGLLFVLILMTCHLVVLAFFS